MSSHYFRDDMAPPKPPLNANGCYDSAGLLVYIRQAIAKGLRPDQMAKHLQVPVDRMTYFCGGGNAVLQKRARVEKVALGNIMDAIFQMQDRASK